MRSSRPELFLGKSCKVAKQLCWNHTLVWMFFCKFTAYFQNTLSYEYLWTAASIKYYYSYDTSFSWLWYQANLAFSMLHMQLKGLEVKTFQHLILPEILSVEYLQWKFVHTNQTCIEGICLTLVAINILYKKSKKGTKLRRIYDEMLCKTSSRQGSSSATIDRR